MSHPTDPSWYSVGPHAWFDLVRMARRGRSTLVRVLYIAAVFGALAIANYNTPGINARGGGVHGAINYRARIATNFTYAMLWTQNLAVLVLMPIYAASAVQEELQFGRLSLVFATHLTNREIILGKWVACIVQIGGVLLAGLPILAVIQLWGGVDMQFIAWHFLQTMLLLAVVGALCLLAATRERTVIRAIILAYLLLPLVVLLLAGTFWVALLVLGNNVPLPDSIWFQGGIFLLLYPGIVLVSLLRAAAGYEAWRHDISTSIVMPAPQPSRTAKHVDLPPVGDSAIVWKEALRPPEIVQILPRATILFLWPIAFFFLVSLTSRERDGFFAGLVAFFWFILILSSIGLIAQLAFGLAGTIVREREQGTLDTLLCLPMSRDNILYEKCLGIATRYWKWAWPILVSWVMLSLGFPDRFGMGVILLATIASQMLLFAGFGLFLSVICRSTLVAYSWLAGVAALMTVMPVIVVALYPMSRAEAGTWYSFSPLPSWIPMSVFWFGQQPSGHDLFTPIVCNSLLAIAFWLLAWWRFRVSE